MVERHTVRLRMQQMGTDELQAIYRDHDTSEYVEEVFALVEEILIERGEELPELGSGGKEAEQSSPSVVQRGDVVQGGFLSFRTMISVDLIRGAYVLGALGFTAFGVTQALGDRLGAGLLIVVGGNILWRLICEAGILLFSIHDVLASIDRKLG